jgi:uncharacterized membrane protein YgcG
MEQSNKLAFQKTHVVVVPDACRDDGHADNTADLSDTCLEDSPGDTIDGMQPSPSQDTHDEITAGQPDQPLQALCDADAASDSDDDCEIVHADPYGGMTKVEEDSSGDDDDGEEYEAAMRMMSDAVGDADAATFSQATPNFTKCTEGVSMLRANLSGAKANDTEYFRAVNTCIAAVEASLTDPDGNIEKLMATMGMTGIDFTAENARQIDMNAGMVGDKMQSMKPNNMNGFDESKVPPRVKTRMKNAQEVVEKGDMTAKSSIYNTFRSYLSENVDDKIKYENLSRPEQAEFKVEWAKKLVYGYEQEYTFCESYQKIDITRGVYQNVSQLVIDEGGWKDEAAVLGVLRLIAMCISMGAPFHFTHPQTRRTLFLKLTFEYREEFTRSWNTFKRQIDTVQQDEPTSLDTTSKAGVTPINEVINATSQTQPRAHSADASACGDASLNLGTGGGRGGGQGKATGKGGGGGGRGKAASKGRGGGGGGCAGGGSGKGGAVVDAEKTRFAKIWAEADCLCKHHSLQHLRQTKYSVQIFVVSLP